MPNMFNYPHQPMTADELRAEIVATQRRMDAARAEVSGYETRMLRLEAELRRVANPTLYELDELPGEQFDTSAM
jgi:hypothetical protein